MNTEAKPVNAQTALHSPTRKPDDQHHKLHKFIKKTLHRLQTPKAVSPGGSSTSSVGSIAGKTPSDIFERSLEANATSILTNPETPSHYTTENYTNPILDTTTEILNDPKVDIQNIKLNCYGDEIDSGGSSPEANIFTGINSRGASGKLQRSESSLDFRPRSRSIISASLMSSLDHDFHDSNDNKSGIDLNEKNELTRRSPSISRLNLQEEDVDAEQSNTIEYYSFADMISHEEGIEDPQPITSSDFAQSTTALPPRRKGSCHTISLKDYIGNV
ncbi:uncharacterized protein CANTADRAFT_23765 [Suhomyces tanzawaensis NRRL Y-17324]|uniref:Uncharacterized protein n=1 Tax=Suhomyces tanzawaensis NRRL Y-17324 TaxID=984487 RepID=A0A1E4SE38_9ASCO|nr:uncharacterized protein CANTADRAFT_23765 [Suhomyces tanzawaensis NRRL Y-17324]ODV77662.1 hypothetical protein CANTADRAFT_23765 [Suhomyces tanzawaensis NRRL Y-17324]